MIIDLGLFGNIRNKPQGELDTLWIQEPNVAQGSFTSNVTIAVTCVFLQMQSCNIVIVQARLVMPIHSLSPAPPSTSLQGKRPKCKGCSFASRMVGSYSVFDSGYVYQSTCCLFLGQGVSITNQIELEAVFSSLEFYNLV